MREIRAAKDLLDAGLENPEGRNDLIHATVTDEEELFDVLGQLRNVYPNILRLDFENSRTAPLSLTAQQATMSRTGVPSSSSPIST